MLSKINTFDLKITRIIQSLNKKPFSSLLIAVSWFGFPPQVFILVFILLLSVRSFTFYFGLASLFIVVHLIKKIIGRHRPGVHQNINVHRNLTSGSFPSGHTATYTYIFGYLIYLVQLSSLPNFVNLTLTLTLTILILLVGPSRIYRGEHWASDVIAGYFLGLVWLLL